MSMLSFFPWLQLKDDLRLPELSLLRFERGRAPGGVDQQAADAILSAYVVGANKPITKATLVQLPDHTLVDDLSDDERDELFALSDLIAIVGLAAREFFGFSGYANHDTFTLVIQSFTDPAGGVAIRSRRRDGSALAYVSPGANIIHRPHHIPVEWATNLDEPLLQGLLRARAKDGWPELEEAIFFFNRANTDNDQVFEQAEIVSTIGAFERVLGCEHGKENALVDRFLSAWPATQSLVHRACSRLPGGEKFRKGPIVETWLRDFYQHRGDVGHGRKRTAHPAVWTAREHLLLGAFAFPLLVKTLLAKRGEYTWTWDDQFDVDVFEQLACAHLFARVRKEEDRAGEAEGESGDSPERDEEERLVWPWHVIRDEAKAGASLRAAIERAFAEHETPLRPEPPPLSPPPDAAP